MHPASPAGRPFVDPADDPRLARIDTWVFDLDNTLYPASCRLFDQVHVRITQWIATNLGLDHRAAQKIQRDYYLHHGSSLRGLMLEHGADPHDFLDFVHAIDYSKLPVDRDLQEALALLPGRKLVYTNGSEAHARNCLAQLGIEPYFEQVHDIIGAGFTPKPQPAAFAAFLDAYEVDPTRAAMIEDLPVNLVPAQAAGLVTVLLVEDEEALAHRQLQPPPGVDHATATLGPWLHAALRARKAPASLSP